MVNTRLIVSLVVAAHMVIAIDCRANERSPEHDAELLAWVDPILHWRARRVRPAQNAWTVWLKAAALAVDAEAAGLPSLSIASGDSLSAIGASDARRQELSTWVKRNEAALKLVDEGLDRPEAELPAVRGFADEFQGGAIRDLHDVRLIRAELSALAGDDARAVDDLLAALKFADRFTMSNGTVLPWLMGVNDQKFAMDTVGRLHEADLLSSAQRRRLIVGLEDQPPDGRGLAQAIRHEFWRLWAWDARQMSTLHKQGGFRAQFQHLLGLIDVVSSESDDDTRPPRLGGRRPWRLIDKTITDQNLVLFKLDEVIRFGSKYCAGHIKIVNSPWSSASNASLAKLEETRKSNRPTEALKMATSVKTFLDRAGVRNAKQMDEEPDGLLSDVFMATLAPLLDPLTRIDRRFQAQRRALVIIFAIDLYVEQHDEPPTTLADLSRQGLLARIPADPFSDQPLRYDSRRRIVWSVGEDGEDDSGNGFADDPDRRFEGEDYVWRIPLSSSSSSR